MPVQRVDPFKEDDIPVNKMNPLDMLDRVQRTSREGIQARDVNQILETSSAASRGMALVSDAMQRAGQTVSFAKTFDRKVKTELEKEFSELALGEHEELDDQAMISKIAVALQRKQQLKGQRENAEVGTGTKMLMDDETANLLQLYLRAYGQLAATNSPLLKKQVEDLEKRLNEKGFSHSHLLSLKLSLKAALRSEIVAQIKDAFIKRALTQEMIVEWSLNTRSLNDILDTVWTNQQLGGKEFGGYLNDLQGAMDQVVDESNRELRTFLTEALKQKMTEKLIGQSDTVTQELKDMLHIASRIGFNVDEYVQLWAKEKIDQGLFFFQKTDEALQLAQFGAGQQQKRHQPQEETTEELFINRYRALCLQNILRNDWLTSMRTQFKMRKLKNGMIKLGIYSENLLDQIQSEALAIARLKTMEMLKEALLERATLYRLEGPAFKLLEKKLVSILRNAARIGLTITEHEFNLLRDNADYRIFEISKRELRLTNIAEKATQAPHLKTKKQKLIRLCNRLRDEAKIEEDLGISADDEMNVDGVRLST